MVAIEEVSPEGILTFSSGADDDANDAIEVTYGSNSFSALISDGVTILECRSALDAIAASARPANIRAQAIARCPAGSF